MRDVPRERHYPRGYTQGETLPGRLYPEVVPRRVTQRWCRRGYPEVVPGGVYAQGGTGWCISQVISLPGTPGGYTPPYTTLVLPLSCVYLKVGTRAG